MTAKEIQDVGKQDIDGNVNRVNVRKYYNRNVNWEMWAKTRAKEMPGFWQNMRQMP